MSKPSFVISHLYFSERVIPYPSTVGYGIRSVSSAHSFSKQVSGYTQPQICFMRELLLGFGLQFAALKLF